MTNHLDKVENVPYLFRSFYDEDVTQQYTNLTEENDVEIDQYCFSQLYLCTYRQKDGWVPVAKINDRFGKKINVGGLIDDCLVIIAKYEKGVMVPISQPHIIRHKTVPKKLEPLRGKEQSMSLYRKYMFGNRWINRWGSLIGTKIETSNNQNFNGKKDIIYQCKSFPTELTRIMLNTKKIKRYIRIFPKEGKFPVFAEITLYGNNGEEIPNEDFCIFAIGKGLTGDTIVTYSLIDSNEETTFYKQFPFWIGLDLYRVKDKVKCLELTMWNDYNRIVKGHLYELFYYNYGWKSLGNV